MINICVSRCFSRFIWLMTTKTRKNFQFASLFLIVCMYVLCKYKIMMMRAVYVEQIINKQNPKKCYLYLRMIFYLFILFQKINDQRKKKQWNNKNKKTGKENNMEEFRFVERKNTGKNGIFFFLVWN